MDRAQLAEHAAIDEACERYGVSREALALVPGYEGCVNLVYTYERAGKPLILRISFRPDRSAEMIASELHFVEYLAEHGVRVSRPVRSEDGRLLEVIEADGVPLHVVSFARGKGMRVPDNGYQYREDAPIEEYFRNWGSVLGQMHALATRYDPPADVARRPGWFELHRSERLVQDRVPARLGLVRERILSLFDAIRGLPNDHDAYGLIHGDFNDGNFTVDYSNGDITVFDFDDCCHFWFMYELAAAWEGGVGRTMFEGVQERRVFMTRYFDEVMAGYSRENTLSDAWLDRLPLFLQLVQLEELLHYAQYLDDPDEEDRAHLAYLIRCIEDEIPYLGFFDRVYSPERPFLL